MCFLIESASASASASASEGGWEGGVEKRGDFGVAQEEEEEGVYDVVVADDQRRGRYTHGERRFVC